MENKRRLGLEKEKTAMEYLEKQGAIILEQNFYFKGGELDLIVLDGSYLCFVEVKYRKTRKYGYAEEAVTAQKQKKMIK